MIIKDGLMYLDYEFDSDYADSEDYERYNGDSFVYKVDLEDIKDTLITDYLKRTDNEHVTSTALIEVLDMLDHEQLINWFKILEDKDNVEFFYDYYKNDAMRQFIEDNYIMTKEDYEAEEADRYNDEMAIARWEKENE